MQAVISKTILLKDCTKEAANYYKKMLSFPNPEYNKKVMSGRWVGNTPEVIRLYSQRGHDLIIPYGMLKDVLNHKQWFESVVSAFRTSTEHIDYKSNIIPYDYQELAIERAVGARQGIIVAPCGAGKTQIGLEIAARIGGRTLWLTHTQDLLNQSMSRAKSVFGLKNDDYGTITSGRINVGNVITFATVQTMSKIELDDFRDYWDVIIVDEAHHAVGTPTRVMMFWKVVSGLAARYKYGLTATPNRADGLTPCMFALLGEKCYEIGREYVVDTTCPVEVKINKTDYVPDYSKVTMPDGTINYVGLIDDIVHCEERNKQIVDDVCKVNNGKSLILTSRVEHIKILKSMLEERGVQVVALLSQNAKKERMSAINALSNGRADVLIATFALAREGLDIPVLTHVFFATPQKNEAIVTQSAGRVARKAPLKTKGIIYDYNDSHFGMLNRWQYNRNSVYRRQGFALQS